MPRIRASQPSLAAVLREALVDLDAACGISPDATDDEPLWRPNRPAPGRGLVLPDGRIVSPQQLALDTPADITGYGGAPGGGKSDLMLGAALTRHRASAIFRRQFAQFNGPKGLIARSREIVGIRGHQANNTWRDLPGGRAIEFLGCDFEKDVYKYLGRAHDLKAFDEATEFPELWYRKLIGWLRTDTVGQRTRVILTFNPPQTEEGRWVIRYFAPWLDPSHPRPAKPGELRWFIVDADGKDVEVDGPRYGTDRPGLFEIGKKDDGSPHFVAAKSRTCIQSAVEDNPYYMATDYAAQLDQLPEPMRSMMRHGNFGVALPDDAWQLIPTAWVVEAQKRWRPDGGAGRVLSMLGCDPSRGGSDEFAMAPRYDDWIAPLVTHQAKEAADGETGARLVMRVLDGAIAPVQIDIGGSAGPAVHDFLKKFGVQAIAMNGSVATKARTRLPPGVHVDRRSTLAFRNNRAKWHWRAREALDPAFGATVALPPDPQLRADLCAIRWEMTLGGILIEDKAEIKARIGRSPDRGEAVIYALADERTAPFEMMFTTVSGDDGEELARLRKELGLPPRNGGNGGANGTAG